MIRSVLRTLLRRQVNEDVADAWTDADLNTLLDAGCDAVGKWFFSGNPDRAPITTTLSAYLKDTGYGFATIALPDGFTRMFDLSLLVNSVYVPIEKSSQATVMGLVASDDSKWAFLGQSIIVGPAPSVSLANGVRIRSWNGITLAAEGTSPPFPASLHMAVVYEAKLITLGEGADDDSPTLRALNRLYDQNAAMLSDGGGEPEFFAPDRGAPVQD